MKDIIDHLHKELKEVNALAKSKGGFDKNTLDFAYKCTEALYNLHYIQKIPNKTKSVSEDSIEDELMGCGEYIEKYEETKDEKYLLMAKDELKHAGMLIDMYPEMEKNHEQHERMEHYKNRLNGVEYPESSSLLMKYK